MNIKAEINITPHNIRCGKAGRQGFHCRFLMGDNKGQQHCGLFEIELPLTNYKFKYPPRCKRCNNAENS